MKWPIYPQDRWFLPEEPQNLTRWTKNDTYMSESKIVKAAFYQAANGTEPVRDWLKSLPDGDRKLIGADIKAVEFGWPLGLPLCRPITGRKGIWEVRTSLTGGRIARVMFSVVGEKMILLHGFIKKTKKTPKPDIEITVKRLKGMKK